MLQKQPHQYSKRVLLLVSGMSPQIITETIYALTQHLQPAFIPTEVHLLTTVKGAEQARLNLLVDNNQYFYKLCKDYHLDTRMFTEANIHVIEDSSGMKMEDIRTPQENKATADFITHKIFEYTQDDNTALHVSIAGGRKTMGYYAGYALSLYGREQDRLSHVLVSEGYESLRDFYYPTPYSHSVYNQKGEALDASKAKVTLAQIPFIPLRGGVIDNNLLDGSLGFNETIERAKKASKNPILVLNPDSRIFQVDNIQQKLAPNNILMLLWFDYRIRKGNRLISTSKAQEIQELHAAELRAAANFYGFNIHKSTLDLIGGEDNDQKVTFSTENLHPNLSRLRSALREVLGHTLASCFEPIINKTEGHYLLPESMRIQISYDN